MPAAGWRMGWKEENPSLRRITETVMSRLDLTLPVTLASGQVGMVVAGLEW